MKKSGPPPKLRVSEWADRHRQLSRESSAEPGQWRTDRAPYQRAMMDVILEPGVEDVVFCTASQIGKTEILNNIVGYFIDQEPSPILVVLPTVELAKDWSQDRLQPMLDDTPVLRGKVRDARSRDSGNTIMRKRYTGGRISAVGANAPSGLSAKPIRIVLYDEVDRFPASAGVEGDPIALAARRTATFWNRKRLKNSTPTIRGLSRIEQDWLASDQREFYVPCPKCGVMQTLWWTPGEGHGGIVYGRDAKDDPVPESARYRCGACSEELDETYKRGMLARGVWRAKFHERMVRGFHISAIYSPWLRWADLVKEWHAARGNPELLKVFVNTLLGETWEEPGEKVDAHVLLSRAESYGAEVPAGVGLLTAAVDVQGDRLEVAVKGWGAGEESWLVSVEQLPGDPGQPKVWYELTQFLRQPFAHVSGQVVYVSGTAVDSGGLHTEQVYRYCQAMASERVVAIKGSSIAAAPLVGRPTRHNRFRILLYTLGVDTAKDMVYSRLRVAAPGPGFMHFPDSIDLEYCEQLCSERAVRRWDKKRGVVRQYVKVRERNEAIDLEVYALAMLHILGPGYLKRIPSLASGYSSPADAQTSETPHHDPRQPAQQPRQVQQLRSQVRRWPLV